MATGVTSPTGFVAYIDEAGDDGIGKFRARGAEGQTHWLVLSALIVSIDVDVELPTWRNEITSAFPKRTKRDLHFRYLSHEQAVHACRVLAGKPAGIISILSNKTTIPSHPSHPVLSRKNGLYKYLLRFLLERVSDACRRRCGLDGQGPRHCRLVFSRRGGMDYSEFQDYMRHLRALQTTQGSRRPIRWDHVDIENIVALDHGSRAGLQLADVASSAFFKAVEPNLYGGYEHRYALELAGRVVKSSLGQALNFGVKPVPDVQKMSLDEEQHRFFDLWKKKEQAPGP
jgi:hypothetical protein